MIEKEKIRQYFDIVVISDYHLKNMKNKEMACILTIFIFVESSLILVKIKFT